MVSRRDVLAGAGIASVSALTASSAFAAQSTKTASGEPSVMKRGEYAKAPLRQDAINVSAIQSRLMSVDVKNRDATMKRSLDHVTKLIDYAQGSGEEWGGQRLWGAKQDLICLHEFPIQGFQPWNRAELNKIAFDLPGPESEVIGERARRYGCYIAFGCYARDKDWPNHVINMSVIVGPDGNIVSKQWKARNILGSFGGIGLIGTTVYDVLDRYVEMYGWDATLPIARTDIGNIAMTAVGMEPMLYQALALKGAEIMILTVTGASNAETAVQSARMTRTYTIGVSNSVSPDNPGFTESVGARDEGTVIVDPRGVPLAKTTSHHEDIATARVPIADFRNTRAPAEFPMALLLPVFQQYQPSFQPNAFLERLPNNYQEAGGLAKQRMGRK
ncbi:hydrolase [Steroidobacter agaridevorans]|uniref:Hydrolase n=1 Tax=Steroidobacter agaridevorans TaxID=2695856 RepID=A0A829YJ35_9GAMM|nr:nitrilase-related carbon-nitrogen hydrolase [Steroidobacter agaridevorans]GFE82872.1 hydrolase [Steroidobacter agaridevorans]GFE85962.1 hydrolase [Steroidobacter agaridevorans]